MPVGRDGIGISGELCVSIHEQVDEGACVCCATTDFETVMETGRCGVHRGYDITDDLSRCIGIHVRQLHNLFVNSRVLLRTHAHYKKL